MLKNLVRVDLESQYRGFNICFWTMLIIAIIASLAGQSEIAIALGTLGLVSGAIGQLKLILINQQRFLANQEIFLANQETFLANQKLFLEQLEVIKAKSQ
ncbi:MAG: hypothetical protein EOO52_11270 [Gammaproteobacteria bacterium]|nr:MAG: hypothetical protein EOO52_11270 [Gammaproteobacteria bacterium]